MAPPRLKSSRQYLQHDGATVGVALGGAGGFEDFPGAIGAAAAAG